MIIVILSKEFVILINVKLFNFRENEKFNIREKKARFGRWLFNHLVNNSVLTRDPDSLDIVLNQYS